MHFFEFFRSVYRKNILAAGFLKIPVTPSTRRYNVPISGADFHAKILRVRDNDNNIILRTDKAAAEHVRRVDATVLRYHFNAQTHVRVISSSFFKFFIFILRIQTLPSSLLLLLL